MSQAASSARSPLIRFPGHPHGLPTLFFTEMWERFSYYGMRALLILYLAEATTPANPGMGLAEAPAGAIYGLYTGLVYLLGLPGGWVADQLWGQRKAIWVGGWFIAAGHFSMAVPTDFTFFLGLILIIIGTGLLKPNVSSIVADLYPEGARAATPDSRSSTWESMSEPSPVPSSAATWPRPTGTWGFRPLAWGWSWG